MKFIVTMLLLLCVAFCGCASKTRTQTRIRRAYAAGEEAARAQMEQQMQAQSQQQLQNLQQNGDPSIRVYGSVRNSVLYWSAGMTLGRALVEAQYERNTTPSEIDIIRNNQPMRINPQSLLQGQDYPLYPGDVIEIQN